ncbi:MAG: type II toxin-antitoxin system VapC family toxin [Verrucomicrobia bacterium]|nr:type II toxin-antitoxin system VapC family toxin [Verrucomicrobiota bacterium]
MIHFDTNFLIEATVTGSRAHAKFRAWATAGETVGIGAVAWAEYLCGPLDPQAEAIARRMFPNPEPFLAGDAIRAAELFNLTGRRSRSLADCMIAAVAIRCGARLATINTADFAPFAPYGLVLA